MVRWYYEKSRQTWKECGTKQNNSLSPQMVRSSAEVGRQRWEWLGLVRMVKRWEWSMVEMPCDMVIQFQNFIHHLVSLFFYLFCNNHWVFWCHFYLIKFAPLKFKLTQKWWWIQLQPWIIPTTTQSVFFPVPLWWYSHITTTQEHNHHNHHTDICNHKNL